MPEITKSESVVATEGSTVQILCRAQGLPTPQISINYLGEKVDEQRYEIKTNDCPFVFIDLQLTIIIF